MSFSFDPSFGAIRVQAEIASPSGRQALTLCLDSGATQSAIRFSKLLAAGFSLRDATASYDVATAGGVVQMLEFIVPRLTSLGNTVTDIPLLAAHEVPGVTHDGLLGLDFLRDKVLTIDFRNGTIDLQ